LNIYSSIPVKKSLVQPTNIPKATNFNLKFKGLANTPGNCTPYNSPPSSNKSLPEGPIMTPPSKPSSMVTSQLSDKKLKYPVA